MFQSRIKKLRDSFNSNNIDALIVENHYNVYYLSGFTGTNGYLLIEKGRSFLITDSRYLEQAKIECKDYEVVNQGKDIYGTLFNILDETNIKNLGFEGNYITLKRFGEYEERLTGINLISVKGEIKKLRETKDLQEIQKIKTAANIADMAFNHILNYLKPGITENEISLEIEYFMKKQGASEISFETIVASGVRSSMPHGVATSKIIEYGDTVTLDFGCIYDRYCSDMTRTVFIGQAQEKIKEIYKIVLEAQQSAIQMLEPGLVCKDADAEARSIISKSGYGPNFGHSLGHSLGLEVHEEPSLSYNSEKILKPGMVVTIEPGIYLEGIGGVRIEDLILITENGYENFVSASKEIIII
ncbi:MAG: M24 family metallopeptidase [Ignavibacteriales bacterium]